MGAFLLLVHALLDLDCYVYGYLHFLVLVFELLVMIYCAILLTLVSDLFVLGSCTHVYPHLLALVPAMLVSCGFDHCYCHLPALVPAFHFLLFVTRVANFRFIELTFDVSIFTPTIHFLNGRIVS